LPQLTAIEQHFRLNLISNLPPGPNNCGMINSIR
jgi:hypothetical protein